MRTPRTISPKIYAEGPSMHLYLAIVGLGLNVIGAIILGFADAWFSRSVLVYLDALETNLANAVGVLQSGGSRFDNAAIDVKRDRGQDRARSLKLLGWAILAVGFLVNFTSLMLRIEA
jgi:hypothetical protein